MLLHLVVDDKFIDAAGRVFEDAEPHGNRFFLLHEQSGAGAPSYLKSVLPERATVADFRRLVRSERSSVDAVVVHYMTPASRAAVARTPAGVPVVWIGWGADYYHLIRSPESLLRERTRELVRALTDARENARRSEHPLLLRVLDPLRRIAAPARGRLARSRERRALSRVDYLAPVITEDADLLKARNTWFRPTVLTWNYPLADSVFDGIDRDGGVTGHDILFGNSAAPTNNHLDALSLLHPLMDRTSRRIICPLSYGDTAYADAIAAEGRRLYGDRFVAVRRFMSPEEYWQTVRSCSTVVMAHLRQQAVGNIVMMMYAGASVYLDRESPAFDFLRRVELPARSLDHLPREPRATTPPAPSDDAEIRARLRQLFGSEAMLQRTRELIAAIRGKR